MSLHPPKFLLKLSPKKPAPRPVYQFCGMPVTVQFSRRPRVIRLEPSRARSGGREL